MLIETLINALDSGFVVAGLVVLFSPLTIITPFWSLSHLWRSDQWGMLGRLLWTPLIVLTWPVISILFAMFFAYNARLRVFTAISLIAVASIVALAYAVLLWDMRKTVTEEVINVAGERVNQATFTAPLVTTDKVAFISQTHVLEQEFFETALYERPRWAVQIALFGLLNDMVGDSKITQEEHDRWLSVFKRRDQLLLKDLIRYRTYYRKSNGLG